MHRTTLENYTKYLQTEEAFAVSLTKQCVRKSKGHWVDIDYSRGCTRTPKEGARQRVKGKLYQRRLKPKYPPKSNFTKNGRFDKNAYTFAVRAITWHTAQRDIKEQKQQGVSPLHFDFWGVFKNEGSFFHDDAPAHIKALEKNLNNRTDPLWDCAMMYIAKTKLVLKIRHIKIFRETTTGKNTPKNK